MHLLNELVEVTKKGVPFKMNWLKWLKGMYLLNELVEVTKDMLDEPDNTKYASISERRRKATKNRKGDVILKNTIHVFKFLKDIV